MICFSFWLPPTTKLVNASTNGSTIRVTSFNPTGPANPTGALVISATCSAVAIASSIAPSAFFSFTSFRSRSPRTNAATGLPSAI